VSFASALNQPWGMTWLPDGRLLVAQKGGSLVLLNANGSMSGVVQGTPPVDAGGQGGLLDVALDPQFATNRRIYLAFSEPVSGGTNRTSVARGVLNDSATQVTNLSVIFRQAPDKVSSGHYGSRLLFRGDGSLFVLLGDRQGFAAEAQQMASMLGKVVRINTDGQPMADNPYFSQGGNAAYVWTLGHRNPQAGAIHPTTGELWVAEHGPQGGDEVNLCVPGRNFGWPTVSYGCNYGQPVGTACRLGGGTHAPTFVEPLVYWWPTSMAPGGMVFYTGNRVPAWQGNLFVGALAATKALYRFELNGTQVVRFEALFPGQHEIRDVRQGPDGYLYIVSRNANSILRIEP
jgi:glucose/arabinose dehydrogenase